MFLLSKEEADAVIQLGVSQIVIPQGYNVGASTPMAFSEAGVAMLSSVLKSKTAINMNISIIRAFIALRQMIMGYDELRKRIEELEVNTDVQFNEIYQALTELASKKALEDKPRNPIGFKISDQIFMIMERGKIEITQNPANGTMTVQFELTKGGTVWLTKHEIADLFNVYPITIVANIEKIFQDNELFENEVVKVSDVKGRNGKNIEYYNLDVVLSLSFRLKGAVCRMFREWIREQVKRPIIENSQANIFIQLGNNGKCNSFMN